MSAPPLTSALPKLAMPAKLAKLGRDNLTHRQQAPCSEPSPPSLTHLALLLLHVVNSPDGATREQHREAEERLGRKRHGGFLAVVEVGKSWDQQRCERLDRVEVSS